MGAFLLRHTELPARARAFAVVMCLANLVDSIAVNAMRQDPPPDSADT
jgi:hypothetical protein